MKKTIWTALLVSFTPVSWATDLTIQLQNQDGAPLQDVVVELVSKGPEITAEKLSNVAIAQKDRTFYPFVSAVPVGTEVAFPNLDKTRHHVYSFSPAKTFELKLYAGVPEKPILFDQTGVVALGCNIHDYMQAYLYVGESPLLAVSDASGTVAFTDLPEGDYEVHYWHPWQQLPPESVEHTIQGADLNWQQSIAVFDDIRPEAPSGIEDYIR